jgi:NhaA family Na+:H+ antiporter
MDANQTQAPGRRTPLERLLSPLSRFLRQSSAGGTLVLAAAILALILAHSPWSTVTLKFLHTEIGLVFGPLSAKISLLHFISDALMSVFFLVVGLEIKEAFLHGDLRDPKQARLPIIAALGGMLAPALFYIAFNLHKPGLAGWGIPMATDIAFAIGLLRLVPGCPAAALTFLAALAIVDDLGAVLVIALFYTQQLAAGPLVAMLALVFALLGFSRAGLRHPLPFILLGLALWVATYASGVHGSIAGVLLAFCLPSRAVQNPDQTIVWTADFAVAELKTPNSYHTIEALAMGIAKGRSPSAAWALALGPWANLLIVPLFALANAGVNIRSALSGALEPSIFFGVLFGLVLGKPLGILLTAWLGLKLGWVRLPPSLKFRDLVPLSILAGVGFTMAIFIAELGLRNPVHIDSAKLATLLASVLAGSLGVWWGRRVFRRRGEKTA